MNRIKINLILKVGVKQELHWCQLNAKSSSRKKLKFLANSESHLKDD